MQDGDVADVLFVVSFIGAILVTFGVLGIVAAIGQAIRDTDVADDDPWGGQTLEWSTVEGRFTEEPAIVHSETPLLDLAAGSAEGGDSDAAEGEEA